MPLLSKESFLETYGQKMVRVGAEEAPAFDFWDYVAQIPRADFQGYDCSEGSVQWVWRADNKSCEHVLIDTKEDKDVFMVIVLDRATCSVVGHHLLDLKSEYGLRK